MKNEELLFKKFGNYLREKRIKAKLTQTSASKILSYTPQFICNWEKGKSMPPFDKLHELSKLYKIDAEELVMEVLSVQEELLRSHLKTKPKTKRYTA